MAKSRDAVSISEVFAASWYVAIALFFGIWLTWEVSFVRQATFGLTADYWGYAAALTEWMSSSVAPGNPHLVADSGSPLYMPFFWLLSELGGYFGIDAIGLLSIASVVNYTLICAGLFLFFRAYFREPWAPLAGFLIVFMFWGVSPLWDNVLQLRSFFFTASYPSAFVFGLSLISFWVVLKALRGDYSLLVMAFVLFLLTPIMLLSHLVVGLMAVLTCLLLTTTESSGSPGSRLLLWVALLAGLAVTVFWPYFSFAEFVQATLYKGPDRWLFADETLGTMERFNSASWIFVSQHPAVLLTIMGPAALGVAAWLWLLVRREQMFIVLGPFVMALPLLLSVVVDIPFAHQFLIFAVYFFQLALLWGALKVFDAAQMLPPPAGAGAGAWAIKFLMLAMVVFNVVLLVLEYQGKRVITTPVSVVAKTSAIPADMTVEDVFGELIRPIEADSVVLATAHAGWPLPAFRGKVVALYQDNPLVQNQSARFSATTNFFYRALEPQLRIKIVRNNAAEFVLLDTADAYTDPTLAGWLNEHAIMVAKSGPYRMYDIVEATLGEPDPEPELEPEQATAEPGAMTEISPSPSASVPNGTDGQEAAPARPADSPPQVMTPEPAAGAEPAPQPSDVVDEAEPQPQSFGAPIPAPMLDPSKHGG